MPRIEIIPCDLKSGDGSPTVDTCLQCSSRFSEGDALVPHGVINDVHEQGFISDSYRVGSTDAAHPSYSDVYCECIICGETLTAVDD